MKHGSPRPSHLDGAFSLIEAIVVLAIVTTTFALVTPAITRVENVTGASYTLQGVFDQARTYAVANNTYTWVGIFEEDGSKSSQNPAQPGTGRVVVSIVASQDGSALYDKTIAIDGTTQSLDTGRLSQLGKLIKLESVHILDASNIAVGKRPSGITQERDLVGLASDTPLFSFRYPLSGAAEYIFGGDVSGGANGIVQFNPRGEAISSAGLLTNPASNLEISIQPAHGKESVVKANIVALNLSGLTGQTTIYRP